MIELDKADEELEEAAMKAVHQFGAPDISGGYVIEGDLVYFKDKDGHTSLVVSLEAFENVKKQIKELSE